MAKKVSIKKPFTVSLAVQNGKSVLAITLLTNICSLVPTKSDREGQLSPLKARGHRRQCSREERLGARRILPRTKLLLLQLAPTRTPGLPAP